jgi:hypothetical protein
MSATPPSHHAPDFRRPFDGTEYRYPVYGQDRMPHHRSRSDMSLDGLEASLQEERYVGASLMPPYHSSRLPSHFVPNHYEYHGGKSRKRSNLPKQSTEVMKRWFDEVRVKTISGSQTPLT